jgi:hypothetical protein
MHYHSAITVSPGNMSHSYGHVCEMTGSAGNTLLSRAVRFVLQSRLLSPKINLQLTTPVILSSFLSRPFEVYDAHIQKMWLRIIPPETSYQYQYQYQYNEQQMHLIKHNTTQYTSQETQFLVSPLYVSAPEYHLQGVFEHKGLLNPIY